LQLPNANCIKIDINCIKIDIFNTHNIRRKVKGRNDMHKWNI